MNEVQQIFEFTTIIMGVVTVTTLQRNNRIETVITAPQGNETWSSGISARLANTDLGSRLINNLHNRRVEHIQAQLSLLLQDIRINTKQTATMWKPSIAM